MDVRLARWIWAAPAVFLVHDGEELATMVPWLSRHRDALSPRAWIGFVALGVVLQVPIIVATLLLARR